MNTSFKTSLKDDKGDIHICHLKNKSNNENGQILYTFTNENTGEDYIITKDSDRWSVVNGNLLNPNWLQQLGDYADNI